MFSRGEGKIAAACQGAVDPPFQDEGAIGAGVVVDGEGAGDGFAGEEAAVVFPGGDGIGVVGSLLELIQPVIGRVEVLDTGCGGILDHCPGAVSTHSITAIGLDLHLPGPGLREGAVAEPVEIGGIPKEDAQALRGRVRHPEVFADVKGLRAIPFPATAGPVGFAQRLVEPVGGIGPELEIGELMGVVEPEDIGHAAGIEIGLKGDGAGGIEGFHEQPHPRQIRDGAARKGVSAAVQNLIFEAPHDDRGVVGVPLDSCTEVVGVVGPEDRIAQPVGTRIAPDSGLLHDQEAHFIGDSIPRGGPWLGMEPERLVVPCLHVEQRLADHGIGDRSRGGPAGGCEEVGFGAVEVKAVPGGPEFAKSEAVGCKVRGLARGTDAGFQIVKKRLLWRPEPRRGPGDGSIHVCDLSRSEGDRLIRQGEDDVGAIGDAMVEDRVDTGG